MPRPRLKRVGRAENPTSDIAALVSRVAEERLRADLKRLEGVRHHDSDPAKLEAAADYLTGEFSAAGFQVRDHRFEAFGHQNRNVVARFPASRGRKKGPGAPLILAAHYDTVSRSPGADDNASGLAALLETARILGPLGAVVPVDFIGFAQEEQHCLGSTLYAIRLQRTGAALRGMISLECVGYASDRKGSQKGPGGLPVQIPEVGNFLGVIGNGPAAELAALFSKTTNHFVPDLPIISLLVPEAGHGFPNTRRSDHAPFWDAGYPALLLTDTADFRNPNYHRESDTLETLDLAFLVKVTKAVVALAARIGAGPISE